MTNISTDLLRAFVTVIDLGSYTKAAAALGISQPAVSGKIKRLQTLLGNKLLNCSPQGIRLTLQGEKVAAHARNMLSINDQIVGSAERRVIKVGTPGDFVATSFSLNLANFREQWPDVRFEVGIGSYTSTLQDPWQGDLDLVIGLSINEPSDAHHHWPEAMAWARDKNTNLDLTRPIPLLCFSKDVVNRQVALMALRNAGLEWDDVLICPSFVGIAAGVAAGLGVTPMVRRRIAAFGLQCWDDGPLPPIADIHFGIYVREGPDQALLEQFSDSIAAALRPDGTAPADFARAHKLVETINGGAQRPDLQSAVGGRR